MRRKELWEVVYERQRIKEMGRQIRANQSNRKCIVCERVLSPNQLPSTELCTTCRTNAARKKWRERKRRVMG